MARRLVVTGGTDGIGRELVRRHVALGDEVIAVGRSVSKADALRDELSTEHGTLTVLTADLDSVTEQHRVVHEVAARFASIDALVLCARFYRSERTETVDGLESTFAHFYLSRFVLTHQLGPLLRRARRPVVVDVAGPGAPLDAVHWDDLQLLRQYVGTDALRQGGKLNDLLGVDHALDPSTEPVRFVLVHPGVTATAFAGDYDEATSRQVRAMQASAKPVEDAVRPIVEQLDATRGPRLRAVVEGVEIPVDGPDFSHAAARELKALTVELLRSLGH